MGLGVEIRARSINRPNHETNTEERIIEVIKKQENFARLVATKCWKLFTRWTGLIKKIPLVLLTYRASYMVHDFTEQQSEFFFTR